MPRKTAFGDWIKRCRNALDLTQAQLAAEVGCAPITIQKIEAGTRRPSRQLAELLRTKLAILPDEQSEFLRLARQRVVQQPPAREYGAVVGHRFDSAHDRPLPVPPTPLLGRENAVAAVCEKLTQSDLRLLTLLGPPGIGKTRIALEVAARVTGQFADGVVFVAFAPVHDPVEVVSTIRHALGIPEHTHQSVLDQVKHYLRDRHLLLVLDNMEHLLPAVVQIAEILGATRSVTVLATSRSALHLSAEHLYWVAPLALPDADQVLPVETLLSYAAVALFVQRIQARQPDFVLTVTTAPTVVALCHRLDGLPLAIELAASRSTLFSIDDLFARLVNRLEVLTDGPRDLPIRQQSLAGTIAWSYELLPPAEQVLFARLGVFVGGWTVDAMQAIMGDDPRDDRLERFASLERNCLIQQDGGPEGIHRFTMLETIREYALEHLNQQHDVDQVRHSHARYYLSLAETAAEHFQGANAVRWLEHLAIELYNIRAALSWSLQTGTIELGLQLAAALWRFWYLRGRVAEGRRWLEALLAAGGAVSASVRWSALRATGNLVTGHGDIHDAERLFQEALVVAEQLGDQSRRATTLSGLGMVTEWRGAYAQAIHYYREALALMRAGGDGWSSATVLMSLGEIAHEQGRYDQAHQYYTDGLTLYVATEDRQRMAYGHLCMGRLAKDQGQFDQALSQYQRALHLLKTIDTHGAATIRDELGEVARYQDDDVQAMALHDESLRHFQSTGNTYATAPMLCNLGLLAWKRADYRLAYALYHESLVLSYANGDKRRITRALRGLAIVAHSEHDHLRATHLFGLEAAVREPMGAVVPYVDQDAYAQCLVTLQRILGNQAFLHAWNEGQGMQLQAIIAQ